MRKTILGFFCAALVAGFCAAASADTDYSCLHSCIADGKAGSACLSQCSHNGTTGNQPPKPTLTDYRCLNLCTNAGKPATSCLSQCTYEPNPSTAPHVSPSPAEGAKAASHNVLQAPIPADDEVVLSSHSVHAGPADKNYTCIAQCLHEGMQVEMCNQNCVGVTPEFNKSQ